MSTDKKQQLEQQLWKIADTLRGKMDADDFNFVLPNVTRRANTMLTCCGV